MLNTSKFIFSCILIGLGQPLRLRTNTMHKSIWSDFIQ